MKKVIFLLWAALFFSCTNKPKAVVATVDNIANGNKVVYLTPYYSNYFNIIKRDTSNINNIYKKEIATPIVNTYFNNCTYNIADMADLSHPIRDTIGLMENIAEVENNRSLIDNTISQALTDANTHLKNDSITVYIIPLRHFWKEASTRMGGVTGYTASSKKILITIDIEIKEWDSALKYTIAHEFGHTYCAKINPQIDLTLLADLVGEGKADSYAHFVYRGIKIPWTSAISDSAQTELWRRIKPDLFNMNIQLYYKVMFGSDTSKTYPLWGGYTLGYSIVQSVLKNNPQLTPEQWMALKPLEILKMSDYK